MSINLFFRKEYILVAFMFSILLIIIVPLSTFVLDFFLVLSLSSAILVLLLSLFVQRPTDLSTFPTLLLILVLFRLALNIATTRSILSEGYLGIEAVSSIISAFGNFVVGGNMIIGVIIFIILVLINFIVVTKGAGRVAEVRARFSLDALPGKQMAIDADLNAGHIDDAQAKERREQLNKELGFYGTMDGSAKFVKGDAIAGIIITLVNLIGGLLIGIFQYDMSAAQSTEIFTILTIGDGLVAQIPSLLISTAAAIIITRSNSEGENFASGVIGEISNDSKSLSITGFALIFFAFIPGFPTGILLTMGLLLTLIGYIVLSIKTNKDNIFARTFKKEDEEVIDKTTMSHEEIREHKKQTNARDEQQNLDKALKLDVCELKLGALLLPLAISPTSELLDKIKNLRVKIAKELGFVIPQIKITDDNTLGASEYSFCIKRVVIAKASIEPNKFLAMGDIKGKDIKGIKTKDPVFGIDSLWIDKHQKNEALGKGLSVIDSASIISTHIAELIRQNSTDILTRDDITKIIDRLKEEFPVLVDEISSINKGVILEICKELLRENIPIIDMLSILESILESYSISGNNQNIPIPQLTSSVRTRLYRLITKTFTYKDGSVHVFVLKPDLTNDFLQKLQESPLGISELSISVGVMKNFIENIKRELAILHKKNITTVVLYTDRALRAPISSMFAKSNVDINVIAEGELDTNANYEVHAIIDDSDTIDDNNANNTQ